MNSLLQRAGRLGLGLALLGPHSLLCASEAPNKDATELTATRQGLGALTIGIVDQKVLFEESQQVKLLKESESLELHNLRKRHEDLQRNWDKLAQQLQEQSLYARVGQNKRREELLNYERSQLEANIREVQEQERYCTQNTLTRINELIQRWVAEVVDHEKLNVDLVFFRGVGPFQQEGAVAYVRPDSEAIIDLTPKIVDWSLKAWSEIGLESVEVAGNAAKSAS